MRSGERGAGLLINLALILGVLILFALVLNIGTMYSAKIAVQKAIDAAALAVGEKVVPAGLTESEMIDAAERLALLNLNVSRFAAYSPSVEASFDSTLGALTLRGEISPPVHILGSLFGDSGRKVDALSVSNASELFLEVVIDVSKSMNDPSGTPGKTKLQVLNIALAEFLSQFRVGVDNIGRIRFAPRAWEHSHEVISKNFSTVVNYTDADTWSITNPQAGLAMAIHRLLQKGNVRSRRAIVIITDGQPVVGSSQGNFTTMPTGINSSFHPNDGGANSPYIKGPLVDTLHTSDYASMMFYDTALTLNSSRDWYSYSPSNTSFADAMTNQYNMYPRYQRLGFLSAIRMADLARAAGIQVFAVGVGPEDPSQFTRSNPWGNLVNDTQLQSPFLRRLANDPASVNDNPYLCVKNGNVSTPDTEAEGCLYPGSAVGSRCVVPCVDTFASYNSPSARNYTKCPTADELRLLDPSSSAVFNTSLFECNGTGSRYQGKFVRGENLTELRAALKSIAGSFKARLIQ